MGELIFTLGMLVIFGIFFTGALDIETGRSVDPIGAAFVPHMVILVGAVLCIAVLVMFYKKYKAGELKAGGKLNPKALALLGLLVAFLLVLDHVGFIVSATVLFFALMLLLGSKSYAKSILTSIVSVCVFVVVFGRILSVPLPRGDGIFRILSHWLF